MDEKKLRRALERFASKPDDALESIAVAAAFLGCSERKLRYHPLARRVYIGPNRYNLQVGNIRQMAGESWQQLGDVAQRVVESCGADVRTHAIKQQRELNRRREKENRQ
jgi:hypothetical protein